MITTIQLEQELRNDIPYSALPTVANLISIHNQFVGSKRGTEIDITDSEVMAMVAKVSDEFQKEVDSFYDDFDPYNTNVYDMDRPGFESSVSGGWLDIDGRFHIDF